MPDNQDAEFNDLLEQINDAIAREDARDVERIERIVAALSQNPNAPDQMHYRNAANNYGRGTRSPGASAGTGQALPERNRQQTPSPSRAVLPPEQTPSHQSKRPTQAERAAAAAPIHAYNADFMRDKEKKSSGGSGSDPAPVQKTPKPRRKGGCLKLLLIPVLIIAILVGLFSMLLSQPKTDQPIGERKKGVSAVLLCGADLGGYRTDTMMLLYVDSKNKDVGLLTLPRDTYTVTTGGYDAKLNSAYGRNDCGEEGMAALFDYVQNILGYRPDGYVLVELPTLEKLVDTMGGVDFDVPVTVEFEQSKQHDEIHLDPGMQHLDGAAAMAVLRYRYGYYNQDIGRQDTQKAFLKAALKQWMTPGNLGKVKDVLKLLREETMTDLSDRNFYWLAWNVLRSGITDIRTDTLPGYADYVGDQSFYILYPNDTVELVNEFYNPYQVEITRDLVNIATVD